MWGTHSTHFYDPLWQADTKQMGTVCICRLCVLREWYTTHTLVIQYESIVRDKHDINGSLWIKKKKTIILTLNKIKGTKKKN